MPKRKIWKTVRAANVNKSSGDVPHPSPAGPVVPSPSSAGTTPIPVPSSAGTTPIPGPSSADTTPIPGPSSAGTTPIPGPSTSGMSDNIPDPSTPNRTLPSDKLSASRRKLQRSSETLPISSQEVGGQKWMLMHIEQLASLFGDLICPQCFESDLTAHIQQGESKGFSSRVLLSCARCPYSKAVMTSPRSRYNEFSYSDENCPYEINKRMVMFSHEVGSSHSALQKFSSTVGIPNMHLKTFQSHDKKISVGEKVTGQHGLDRAAEEVRKALADTDPDILDDATGAPLDISVSFDGTWQKRGFTSLYGVGVVIEITTGLVLDYEVLSKYCHGCKLAEAKGMCDDDFFDWREGHRAECCINFEGSSKAMESEAARRMWGRSVEKHNFRYTEMLSDGDSSAFKAVSDMNVYGDNVKIDKLECVNHAHKRMGTALRKLSKEERLGGRGKGRLTEAKCKDLQNFYRGAIINNLGDTKSMRNAIWAALWHSMSTDDQPRHHQCPQGDSSWCFYQRALAAGEVPPSHVDHPASTHLAKDVSVKLIPIYRRMSDDALLNRMRHGRTQNANESFNNLIWLTVPKTLFFGKNRIDAAGARAVLRFNDGALAVASVMNKLNIEFTEVSLNSAKDSDKRRVTKGDKKSQEEEIKRRKFIQGQKFAKRINLEAQESDDYSEGNY